MEQTAQHTSKATKKKQQFEHTHARKFPKLSHNEFVEFESELEKPSGIDKLDNAFIDKATRNLRHSSNIQLEFKPLPQV